MSGAWWLFSPIYQSCLGALWLQLAPLGDIHCLGDLRTNGIERWSQASSQQKHEAALEIPSKGRLQTAQYYYREADLPNKRSLAIAKRPKKVRISSLLRNIYICCLHLPIRSTEAGNLPTLTHRNLAGNHHRARYSYRINGQIFPESCMQSQRLVNRHWCIVIHLGAQESRMTVLICS